MSNNAIIPIGNLSGSITTGGLVPGLPIWTGKASGSIASFPDGSDNPIIALDFSIDPVQEGSGDPSPENVRPISGWTGAKIIDTGKNVFNPNDFENNYTLDTDTGLPTAYNGGVAITKPIKCEGYNSAYLISDVPSGVNSIFSVLNNGVLVRRSSGNPSRSINTSGGNQLYIAFYKFGENLTTSDIQNIQIELGATSASTYEAYSGTEYTLPFKDSNGNPLTIYGGKIHIRRVNGVWSGEIISERLGIKAKNLQWTYQSTGERFYTADLVNTIKKPPQNTDVATGFLSEFAKTLAVNSVFQTYESIGVANSGNILFKTQNYTDETQFINALGETIIVYPIATSITYPINPSDIPNILTRLGYNNLWSNTGDIDQVFYMRNWNIALNMLWEAVFG